MKEESILQENITQNPTLIQLGASKIIHDAKKYGSNQETLRLREHLHSYIGSEGFNIIFLNLS
ncbi:unnamed protein product [Paramecium octaurelia]|uniref:Uncharacterized protein n=1 Tax=Paramecium octaurelia TaxID=43137 RepID=A0A8S1VXC4_PAROT|nr:unnamed protein product [Paramecium octaurelia]